MSLDFLSFKQIGIFTVSTQIYLVFILFVFTLVSQKVEYKNSGFVFGKYPWKISTFFSSIYEEVIFRGFLFFWLMNVFPVFYSVVISSTLFGFWHLKNYKWQSKKETTFQVLYTGMVFSPMVSVLVILTGTIWMPVIFHYAHNLAVFYFNKWKK